MNDRKCRVCKRQFGSSGCTPHCESPTCDFCKACYAAKVAEGNANKR